MSFPAVVVRTTASVERPAARVLGRSRAVGSTDSDRLPWWPALLVCGLAAVGWSAVALTLHAGLRTGMDLAIFDQAVRSLSHGKAPYSAIKGTNLWGDHFHPAILLLAPLYCIRDDPRLLLVAQSFLIGFACAVIARCAQRVLAVDARDRLATILGLCLAGSVGVQGAGSFDFHEVALAAVPVALSSAALVERRYRAAALWSLAVLPVKEDMGLVVLGVCLVLTVRGQWRLAIAPAVLAIGWMAAAVKWVIPGMAGREWTYGSTLSGDPAALLPTLAGSLTRTDGIGLTACALLLAAGLLALRSPVALAALPILLARGITTGSHLPKLGLHYDLLPQILLFAAALDMLQGFDDVRARRAIRVMAVATVTLLLVGPMMWRLPVALTGIPRAPQAGRALTEVPADAQLAVDPRLASHASPTHPRLQLLEPDRPVQPTVGWVVLDLRAHPEGEPTGLRRVAQHGDFVVLRR
ncbi:MULTISPECIES: DUF2079 domain-containing protein [unclassified Luteococcus]|uniref:DUF2079 domain-containing protein n=1 Tax=unclassified Luteococcus TaxID=2639923 RepID=UPI00313CEA2B